MTPGNEPFSRWVAASLILHAVLFGAAMFGGFLFPTHTTAFGSPDGDLGAVVKVNMSGSPGILTPPRPIVNTDDKPADSQGHQPEADKVKPERGKNPHKPDKPIPSTRGIQIPDPDATTKPHPPTPPGQMANAGSTTPLPPNAVPTANAGGALDIMYGRKETGTGAASAGFSDKAFGRDFAWYADRLTAAVTQYWTPAPGATSTPRVYVTFTVNKDGTVRDLEFEKKSNNDALDNSAKRAVMQAAANQKIPPLPPDFRGSSIKVRLSFEYIVR